MAYVNFNPIRAKIADTPETPEHTDIQQRMKAIQQPYQYSLMPFIGNPRQEMPKASPFHSNYCELVYISDRTIRNDTAGHINHQNQPILQRLGLSYEQFFTLTTEFKVHFFYAPWLKRKRFYTEHKFKSTNKFIELHIPAV